MTLALTRAEVAERVRAEGPVSLDQAAILIPARNARGHTSPATLLRWIINGKSGVRLEGARVKGKWHTSLAALQRFRSRAGV